MKEDEANEIKDLVSVIYKKSFSNTQTHNNTLDNTEDVHLNFFLVEKSIPFLHLQI